MTRSAVAVVAGSFAAFFVVMAVQLCNLLVAAVPPDVATMSYEEKAAFVRGLPVGAVLVVLLSYVLGPLTGAFVAARLARRAPLAHAAAVAALFLAAIAYNLIDIPHPLWFTLLAPPAAVAAAWLGARAGKAATSS